MEHSSHHGNNEGTDGNKGAIIVPISLCNTIKRAIEVNDLVEEKEVLTKFHITKKTLQNRLRKLHRYYTTAFNGSRWWRMSLLLGIKNILSPKKLRKAA
jgi:hypothetical protein